MIAFDAAHKAVHYPEDRRSAYNHPPAGATTMIVSLGIVAKLGYLPIIEIAVVLLAVQAFAINRLAGLPYPIWRSHTPHTGGSQ